MKLSENVSKTHAVSLEVQFCENQNKNITTRNLKNFRKMFGQFSENYWKTASDSYLNENPTIFDLYFSQVHFQNRLMSQSVPTGHIPPGNPGENFLRERIPATQAFFCSIPCPEAKMMVEFPGVGQNFPKLEETAL